MSSELQRGKTLAVASSSTTARLGLLHSFSIWVYPLTTLLAILCHDDEENSSLGRTPQPAPDDHRIRGIHCKRKKQSRLAYAGSLLRVGLLNSFHARRFILDHIHTLREVTELFLFGLQSLEELLVKVGLLHPVYLCGGISFAGPIVQTGSKTIVPCR